VSALSYTVPSDTHVPGDANHTVHHNDIADLLALLTKTNPAVTTYGADLTGATDSTAALNAALAAVPVVLPTWATPKITGPVNVPAGGLLMSGGFPQPIYTGPGSGAVLKVDASFSGSNAVTVGNGGFVGGIALDLSSAPASVAGIQGGSAANGTVKDVYIYKATGIGLDLGNGAHGWHCDHVKVDGGSVQGVACGGHYDGQFYDVHVIGTAGHCWSIASEPPNTRFAHCRAEWAGTGKDGFHLAGAWNTGTGSGAVVFDTCTTDRNDNHGFGISSTGTTPIVLSNCSLRRDGRNGNSGGGNFGGLGLTSCTSPVLARGLTTFTGVDDNGTGTNSPNWSIFLSGTNSYLELNGALLHGNSATGGLTTPAPPFVAACTIAGTAPTKFQLQGVAYRSGSTSAPSAIAYLANTQT
jgi:hypothetical protein